MNLTKMALVVIEFISSRDFESADSAMSLIYRAAHVANGECVEHEDWKDWLIDYYNSLVKTGKYNPQYENELPAISMILTGINRYGNLSELLKQNQTARHIVSKLSIQTQMALGAHKAFCACERALDGYGSICQVCEKPIRYE